MQKIIQYLQNSGVQFPETLLRAFNDLYSRQALTTAAVTGVAAVTATTGVFHAVVNGALIRVAAGTTPSMTGYNLTSAQVGGFVITVDASGTFAALPLSPAATAATVGWPAVPTTQAVIGLILINTTGAATFTGGTTNTNAANVACMSIVGPFNPTNIF